MANHTTAPIGQSIKRKALLWAGYGPTSTDLHILCRMCTARGNAPLLSPMATSLHGKASHVIFRSLSLPYKSRSLATPEGEILAALCLDVLMRPKAERRANFPLRGGKGTGFVGSRRATENPVTCFPLGEVPPQAGIGVHFHERSEVVWFSLPLAALPPLAAYKIHRPTGRYLPL